MVLFNLKSVVKSITNLINTQEKILLQNLSIDLSYFQVSL